MSNTRKDQILTTFVNSLSNDYYVDQAIPDGKCVLSITQRAPVGSRWPNGQKFRQVGKLTRFQLNAIDSTSSTLEEAVDRVRRLIIDGIDTTHAAPAPNADQIAELVSRLAAAEVDRRIKQIESGAYRPESVEGEVVRAAKVQIYNDSRRPSDDEATVDMWTRRAAQLGMQPPTISSRGRIDGRWLRRARSKWAEHQALNPDPASA